MYGYIYKFTLIPTGKIYIGKRQKEHFDNNYWGSGVNWVKAIKNYSKNDISREVLEWCETKEDLIEKEIYWISKLNSRNPEIGYNISKGGNGGLGHTKGEFHHSDETKKLISEKNKGCKSPIKGKIAIYNNSIDKVIYIDPTELDIYLSMGWIKFNPKAKIEHYKLMISPDGNNNQVPLESVEYYKSLGWVEGRTWAPCLGIKQSEYWKNKRVEKVKLALTGRLHITNGKNNKLIDPKEISYYLCIGWLPGGTIQNTDNMKGKSKGRKWIHSGNTCKFVLPNEVDYYISQGWELGRVIIK